MSDQLLTPNTQSTDKFSAQLGGRIARYRARFGWAKWTSRQQWLVLFAMGAMVIVIEVRNHTHMWLEHGSGQTVWTDPELIGEIILFGLVFPILAGVTLGYLTRTAVERDKMARELELRRSLVTQIQQVESWSELADLVVRIPGKVVSADRAWLLTQRSGEEEFDQVVGWERSEPGLSPVYAPVSPAVCASCSLSSSLGKTRILACQHANLEGSASLTNRYCLWLSAGDSGKTAVLFDVSGDHLLDSNQIKVLDDLGDEVSLAVDNANLQYAKQQRADSAKQERLRIARDLHDSLGQNISVLRMKLEHLSDSRVASGSTAFQNELTSMLLVADEAYEQVRDTLEELRTTEHVDLEGAIRLYASQVAERAGFSAEVRSIGRAVQLSPRQNRQIMYIVREALINAEKHAGASQVDITLQWREAEFELTMADDGQGFEQELVNSEEHYGLSIMAERSRAMNADLVIQSMPGNGTEVRLVLPLSSGAQARKSQ